MSRPPKKPGPKKFGRKEFGPKTSGKRSAGDAASARKGARPSAMKADPARADRAPKSYGPRTPDRKNPRPNQSPRERSDRDRSDSPTQTRVSHISADGNSLNRSEVRYYGLNAVKALCNHRPQDIQRLYFLEELLPEFRKTLRYLAEQKRPYRAVSAEELAKLAQSEHHGGAVALAYSPVPRTLQDSKQFTNHNRPELLLVTLDVKNPHNLGAIFRTAAHFGVSGLVICDSAIQLGGSLARVAEGGIESVPAFVSGSLPELLAQLESLAIAPVATVPDRPVNARNGEGTREALTLDRLPKRCALFLGNEEHGLPREFIDSAKFTLAIPGTGSVESLNVSATAAVLCSAWRIRYPLR